MAAIIDIVTSILADAPAAVLCLVFEEIRFQLLPLDMLEAILHLSRGGAETKFHISLLRRRSFDFALPIRK